MYITEGSGGLESKFCSFCGQRLDIPGQPCLNCSKGNGFQIGDKVEEQIFGTTGIPVEFLKAFTKKDVYLAKWGKNSGWNWPAFLFPPIWMAYRKLYVESAIYFGIIVLLSIIESFVGYMSSSIYLLISIFAGVYGNKIYYRKAKKTIEEIMALHEDKERRLLLIGKKGGTSGWGIFCGIMLVLASSVLMVFVDETVNPETRSVFYSKGPEVIFAEDADDQLNAIHPGTTFPQGTVMVILRSYDDFAVNNIKITITKKVGGSELIVKHYDEAIDPKWGTFGFEYNFIESGQYDISFTKPSGDLIGSGRVNIE
ncbi:DUF2628 domain-containing protein [Cohnella mopanensis]|uniref:DUF2628 domain-containing protein n=1 Tax=Cohnella mopanensis TaxID=2911966 RepID=UPI001EF8FEBE|nr:DUF2628 domain-containing protein [Cohnella mopanensis]